MSLNCVLVSAETCKCVWACLCETAFTLNEMFILQWRWLYNCRWKKVEWVLNKTLTQPWRWQSQAGSTCRRGNNWSQKFQGPPSWWPFPQRRKQRYSHPAPEGTQWGTQTHIQIELMLDTDNNNMGKSTCCQQEKVKSLLSFLVNMVDDFERNHRRARKGCLKRNSFLY